MKNSEGSKKTLEVVMFQKFFSAILATWLFFIPVLQCGEPSPSDQIEEGWVAYATANYFSLAEVMIASVHAFSTRPIVLVTLNADAPFSTEQYPRLIKKRIDVDLEHISPYLYKPKAILSSGLENGVYIDCDVILNKNCDTLFNFIAQAEEHPLCPLHEKDADVSWEPMVFFGLEKRSMHYVHADVLVFSKQSQPFLTNWCNLCLNFPFLGNPCYDETLLNVSLWRIGATQHLPTIDPYNAYFADYFRLNAEQIQQEPYSYWYLFHGNKNPEEGWRMLNSLYEKHLLISKSGL